MKRILGIVFILGLVWACSKDSDTEDPNISPGLEANFERGTMLVNWTDNIIIPSYEAFSADMASLNTSFEEFRANASEANLLRLREAWGEAYKTWQHVDMFEIGPAETVGLRLNMNIYPTDATKIDTHVSTGVYDLSLSSNRNAKGFPALDYLINGLDVDDPSIVAKFNASDKESLLTYMEAVLNDMTTLSNSVLEQWKSGYRDTFVANNGASATASVDRMVNAYIFYFEKFLRAGKMGIPLGVFSGSPLPENVEGYYDSEVSNTLFLEGLNAAQDFFNGKYYSANTSGESLASYLEVLNTVKNGEDLKKIINAQFDTSRTSVTGLTNFRDEIEDNAPPTDMFLAYDEVQRLVPLLKVDMVSAMSISIDFVDADGD